VVLAFKPATLFILLILNSRKKDIMAENKRISAYPIEKLLLERHTSRALSGEEVSHEELMCLFEAARWAPSSFNIQPWRFVYATQADAQWAAFMDLLVPQNRVWAERAWALIILISNKNMPWDGTFSITHSYDTGAAGQNMMLQGYAMGLNVHPLSGFSYAAAAALLELTDEYAVEVMFAVGRHGSVELLPEKLQGREVITDRLPLEELVFHERFAPKK
jgi:nitroreductase